MEMVSGYTEVYYVEFCMEDLGIYKYRYMNSDGYVFPIMEFQLGVF